MTIEQLQIKKNTLLSQFEALSKQHAELYSNFDIEAPKSENEKMSENQKSELFSEINAIVKEIRELKRKLC